MAKFGEVKFGEAVFGEYTWAAVTPTGQPMTYIIKVDGVAISNWSPDELKLNYNEPSFFNFWINEAWDNPAHNNNQQVELFANSNLIFKGRIVSNIRNGVTSNEIPTYQCLDASVLLKSIEFIKSGSMAIIENPQPGEVEFGLGMKDSTCGE